MERINSVTLVKVLLVEDDPADQKLIKASLTNQKIADDLHIVNSAEEAPDFLYSCGACRNRNASPDLILLDPNMPEMEGREFLKHIKEDDGLKRIAVVIVSTSNSERNILDSYRLQAAGYVHKLVTLDEFMQVVGEIGDY